MGAWWEASSLRRRMGRRCLNATGIEEQNQTADWSHFHRPLPPPASPQVPSWVKCIGCSLGTRPGPSSSWRLLRARWLPEFGGPAIRLCQLRRADWRRPECCISVRGDDSLSAYFTARPNLRVRGTECYTDDSVRIPWHGCPFKKPSRPFAGSNWIPWDSARRIFLDAKWRYGFCRMDSTYYRNMTIALCQSSDLKASLHRTYR